MLVFPRSLAWGKGMVIFKLPGVYAVCGELKRQSHRLFAYTKRQVGEVRLFLHPLGHAQTQTG